MRAGGRLLANLKKQAESEDPGEEERSRVSVSNDSPDGARPPAVDKDSVGIRTAKGGDQWVPNAEKPHPSRTLEMRSGGYGIAAGYEKPYKRARREQNSGKDESYGPIPHSGYYGAGEALRPFKFGEAGFDEELEWYRNQYGKETSGYRKKK
jgi:hypothetical protein